MQTDVVIRATVTKPDGIAYYGASFVRVTIGAKIGVGMSDLIRREDAIEALDFNIVHMTVFSNDEKNGTNPFAKYNKGLEDGIKAIRALPSAEPERKTGKWCRHYARPNVYEDLYWHCSACGYKCGEDYANVYYNFCPNCGAEMTRGDR